MRVMLSIYNLVSSILEECRYSLKFECRIQSKTISLLIFVTDKCKMSGTIPTELGTLHDLKYLDLSYNNLSGEVPPELGLLTRLGKSFFYYLSVTHITLFL
jgi:Leucine-rich repeat (LRR) protein